MDCVQYIECNKKSFNRLVRNYNDKKRRYKKVRVWAIDEIIDDFDKEWKARHSRDIKNER